MAVLQSGNVRFEVPAPLVSAKFAPVLKRRLHPVLFLRANQINITPHLPLLQGIRTARFVIDEPFGLLAGKYSDHLSGIAAAQY
jgi:hypothetical protein